MGGCCGRIERPLRLPVQCPRCGRVYPQRTITYRQFNVHLDSCLEQGLLEDEQQPREVPRHLSFWERVGEEGNVHWEKRQFDITNVDIIVQKEISVLIVHLDVQDVSRASFGEKQVWFRGKLEAMRVSWRDGCKFIKISAEDLIPSSYNNMRSLTNQELLGELKIVFTEDTKVQDAGGLLREWVGLTTAKLAETGALVKVSADCYHMSTADRAHDFELFGLLVGKALFEKIPIPTFFSRSWIKNILDLPIDLEDFKHHDSSMYQSFKYLLENEIDPLDILLDFTLESGGQSIQLKENGSSEFVNNDNKQEYVRLAVKYYTQDSVQRNLQPFLMSFFRVIPLHLIQVFTPEELEMVLFGLPFINLADWKLNTEYKGVYNSSNQVIVWFWEVLEKFNQQQLSQFLRFCTGSSRTPVQGFKNLEGSRGEVNRFCIESQEFSTANPYPKAHTCFNRLELPLYGSCEEVEMYVKATLESILEGQFGLE